LSRIRLLRSRILPWVVAGTASLGLAQPVSTAWERCLASRAPHSRWALPAFLREVSGLALGDDGRLWVHNDEAGVIGAFDPATGKALGGYRLGPETPRADFEGIAVVGPRVYLIASTGLLLSAVLPAPTVTEGTLPFEAFDTGVGKVCEVEGLSHDPTTRVLLLACKNYRAETPDAQVAVFRWSLDKRALASPDRVLVPVKALAKGRPGKGFHPSAIERDPATGNWVLLASADNAFAVVAPTGQVITTGALRGGHPQPEGLAIDTGGRFYVGDEGTKRLGTVTVYVCR